MRLGCDTGARRTAASGDLQLVRGEVAVVGVGVDAGDDAVHVELGVELRRVHVLPDPEHLHGAARR